MLYNANGSIARSASEEIRADRQSELENQVRERLKSIDSLLDIQYIEWAGRYALICQWPQSDPRWKMFQSGEIGAPFDNLGWFCQDMQDPMSLPVSIDSIENLVLDRLASCDNTIHPWKGRMQGIIEKNAKLRKDRKSQIVDQAAEIADTLYKAAGHMDQHKLERMIDEVSQGKH